MVYQHVVVAEFRKAFDSARTKLMTDIDRDAVERHPLLLDTLGKINGVTVVDDVSRILSQRGDELHALAEANRTTPEWPTICVAMGAVRTAAVQVWNQA